SWWRSAAAASPRSGALACRCPPRPSAPRRPGPARHDALAELPEQIEHLGWNPLLDHLVIGGAQCAADIAARLARAGAGRRPGPAGRVAVAVCRRLAAARGGLVVVLKPHLSYPLTAFRPRSRMNT